MYKMLQVAGIRALAPHPLIFEKVAMRLSSYDREKLTHFFQCAKLELGGPLQFIDLFKVLNVVYLFVSDENTKIH